jgi:hypothetical protein
MDFINKMRMRAKSVSQRSKSGSKKIRRQSIKNSWKDLSQTYQFGDIAKTKTDGENQVHVALRVQVIRCRNIGKEKTSLGSPSAPTVRRMRSSSSDAKDLHLPNAYVSITYVPLVFQTFNSLQIQYTHTHTHTQTGLKIKKKVHREFEVSIPCTTKNMKEKQ